MKLLPLGIACVLALIASLPNGTAEESPWKMQVELVDGSRVIGTPANQTIQVNMGFGQLEIPLEKIRRADWDRESGKTRIELNDQSIFAGRVRPDPIELDTLFGKVTLEMRHFRAMEIRPANVLGWLPSQQGLQLYYPFDRVGDGVVTNRANKQLTGKLNSARWIREGQRGGAVQFDGRTHIEIPHDPLLCPQQLTLAVWIKPEGDQSSYRVIAGKTAASSWQGGYGLVRMPGDPDMIYFFVNGYTESVAKTKMPSEGWSHIAGVCDGERVQIYLNGKLMDQTGMPATEAGTRIRHTDVPLYLASDARGYAWNGALDEFALYNRALTSREIQQLYAASADPWH